MSVDLERENELLGSLEELPEETQLEQLGGLLERVNAELKR